MNKDLSAEAIKTRSNSPLTLGLFVVLILILFSGGLVVYNLYKPKSEVKLSKVVDSTKNVQGMTTQDLATLENKDAGYTVKYPANFDAMYTQNGVEFTPKTGQGKIILQVKDQIANVTIQQDQVEQSQQSILDDAAETIKNTFQVTQPTPTDNFSNKGRFSNIHFNPKKY